MTVVLNCIFLLFLLHCNLVKSFALPFEGLYKLNIIHYNDFHARFEETSVETPSCRFNNNSCLGGFPRLYHEIQVLLHEKPDALLLNAGDSFQGTYWYTLLKWNITQQFMNLLPHDAHAVGNHEFDDGPEGLAPYFKHLKAPVLAANMDTSEEPLLQGLYRNSTIVTRHGRKIGLIGLITVDTEKLSSPGKVKFTDPGEATLREAKLLTEQGVDIIVLLSHCGFDVDKFEETSVETPSCRFNNNSCLGGFPRLYHQIQVLLHEKPDALLLNAGDSFQGTYWYTLLKWNITQQFMNLLPHDAHAVGNHEFDDGPEGLAPYFKHLKAPVLVANMDTSEEPLLQGLYRNSTIVTRHGRKIGLIGLITVDTEKLSSPGKVKFTDPGEATLREAKLLTEQGVDIIVLLSHCGFDVDKELARNYGEYIDIIVGGHTHSLLWNGESPSGETVAGPYPVFIENAQNSKHQVLIVQASAFTKYMGNLSVYFDYLGNYVKWEGGPIFLDRSIAIDEDIKAKLAPYAEKVHEAENVPVGETNTTLGYEECVYGECALGNMLCDAFNELGKAKVNTSYHHISFIQRGNIKSTLPQGVITKGEIFELLPYRDRIETFEIKGKYVLEALERSVSDAWAYNPFKGPWVLQVSGLQVVYNVSLPEGQRVTSVSVGVAKEPLNTDDTYQLNLPAYLADGGDGFLMFVTGKQNMRIIGRDQEATEAYLKEHSPLNLKLEGRIVINS